MHEPSPRFPPVTHSFSYHHTVLTPRMITPLLSLLVVGSASASPAAKRWTDSQADCWTFYSDIEAETANNIDLASVIG